MSPTWVGNKQLGVASNGVFTDANTDPIPGGILWNGSGSWAPKGDLGPAQSWNDLREYIGFHHGVWIAPLGSRSSGRGIADQWFFYNNQPPPAAFPGTSNHGWGLAVDVATTVMAALILRYGGRFGWSWDEGKRAGEWWHMRYIGGYTRRIRVDPLTRRERRLLDTYPKVGRLAQDGILDDVAIQIRTIRERAEHERNGWASDQRSARYKVLTEWFNGKVAPSFLSEREQKWKLAYYGASPTRKREILATIREQVEDLDRLAHRRGGGGWRAANRGERRQHLARFADHRP
jgi:hypothetical protein